MFYLPLAPGCPLPSSIPFSLQPWKRVDGSRVSNRENLVICWPFPLHSTKKCFRLAAESPSTSSLSENRNVHQTLILPFAMITHSLSLWSPWKESVLPSVQNLCGLEVQDCASTCASKTDRPHLSRQDKDRRGVQWGGDNFTQWTLALGDQ